MQNRIIQHIIMILGVCVLAVLTGAQPPTETTLFYFETRAGECQWQTHDLTTQQAHTFLTTPTCPDHVVFDLAAQRVVYLLKQELYTFSWQTPAAPTHVTTLPAEYAAARLGVTAAGHIRIASLVELPDTATRRATVNGEQIFLFSYAGQDYPYEWTSEQFIGLPAIAILNEYRDQILHTLTLAATTTAACDTLGADALRKQFEFAPTSLALANVIDAATYQGQDFGSQDAPLQMTPAEQAAIAALFQQPLPLNQRGEEEPRPAYRTLDATTGLLVNTVFWYGFGTFFIPPLAFCEADCTHPIALQADYTKMTGGGSMRIDGQATPLIAVAVRAPYLLVAGENRNAAAAIFRFGAAQPVLTLPEATSVIWAPFDGFWQTFSAIRFAQ